MISSCWFGGVISGSNLCVEHHVSASVPSTESRSPERNVMPWVATSPVVRAQNIRDERYPNFDLFGFPRDVPRWDDVTRSVRSFVRHLISFAPCPPDLLDRMLPDLGGNRAFGLLFYAKSCDCRARRERKGYARSVEHPPSILAYALANTSTAAGLSRGLV